jgi:hypothetical protein
LLAGAKPRVRITVPAEELERTARHYRSAGGAVRTLDRTVTVRGKQVAVLYAAREQQAAIELRDLEAEFFRAQERNATREEQHRFDARIGELLGYPPCCVEAFCARARPVEGVADAFRAARAAWLPRPYARLNNTLLPMGRSLISFEPCAYDCAAALAVAERIAEALDMIDTEARRALDEVLARAVLVHPSGLRAWIEIEARAAPTIASAEAVPLASEGVATERAIALAREFVGRPLEQHGLVRPEAGDAAVAVDFGARLR